MDIIRIKTNRYTEKELLKTLRENGMLLQYVPQARQNHEIVETAVYQNPLALRYANPSYFSADIIYESISKKGMMLEYVSKKFLTYENCMVAISNAPMALQFVPVELQDRNMVETACRKKGSALEFVRKDLINDTLVSMSVKQNGLALKFAPDNLKNSYVSLTAVNQDFRAFEYVLPKFQSNHRIIEAYNESKTLSDFPNTKPLRQRIFNPEITDKGVKVISRKKEEKKFIGYKF